MLRLPSGAEEENLSKLRSVCQTSAVSNRNNRHATKPLLELLNFSTSSHYRTEQPGGHCVSLAQPEAKGVKRQQALFEPWL